MVAGGKCVVIVIRPQVGMTSGVGRRCDKPRPCPDHEPHTVGARPDLSVADEGCLPERTTPEKNR